MATTHTNGSASVPSAVAVADKYSPENLPSSFIGLHTVDAAPDSDVKAFVKSHNGHTVIKSVRLLLPRLQNTQC